MCIYMHGQYCIEEEDNEDEDETEEEEENLFKVPVG